MTPRTLRTAIGGVAVVAVATTLLGATRERTRDGADRPEALPVASTPRQEVGAAALLGAIAGTPPVACELLAHGLGNRWGGSSVRPTQHPPLGASSSERALAEWAWSEGPEGTDAVALVDGLSSNDACVQRVAAELLGYVDDPATVASVTRLARTGSGSARMAAMRALSRVARQEATAVLAASLEDGDPAVRRAAAWALSGSGRYAPVDALGRALASSDLGLRENAAWALGRVERREGMDPLVRALADRERSVRINAAWALGELEDERAIPPLAELLGGDSDGEVRRAAAWALGRIER